jgi:hypothetical protein
LDSLRPKSEENSVIDSNASTFSAILRASDSEPRAAAYIFLSIFEMIVNCRSCIQSKIVLRPKLPEHHFFTQSSILMRALQERRQVADGKFAEDRE